MQLRPRGEGTQASSSGIARQEPNAAKLYFALPALSVWVDVQSLLENKNLQFLLRGEMQEHQGLQLCPH